MKRPKFNTAQKIAAALLFIILILVLCLSCSRPSAPASGKPDIPADISVSANIDYKGKNYKANIVKTASTYAVEITDPPTLKGLKWSFDGVNTEISYKGIKTDLGDKSLLSGAISNAVIGAINNAAGDSGVKVAAGGNSYSISGKTESGNYVLSVDKTTGEIKKLEIPDIDFSALFSGIK
jgi:hypothetical protein